jgi:outer membrane receptor for ferrienterochelin and colicins
VSLILHRWVEDVEDLIPLDLDDSQPGNLPDGRHWGINVVFGLRFEDLGLPGAVLNGYYTWQASDVIDPFSGETRPFLDQKQFEAGFEFRHDIERFRGAYGVSWSGEGRRHRYDVDRVDSDWNDDAIEMFIERRLRGSLILRLTANQIYEPRSERTRFNYQFGRSTGIHTSAVRRDQILRRFVTLSLSGAF